MHAVDPERLKAASTTSAQHPEPQGGVAGHPRDSSVGAAREWVVPVELGATGRQPVDGRRLDLAALATDDVLHETVCQHE